MVTKKCAKCKEEVPVSEFGKAPRNSDGLQSYCNPCNYLVNRESQLNRGKKFWHQDGYLTEAEHFNAALEHYAELFNCPSLINHKKQLPKWRQNQIKQIKNNTK